MTDNEIKKALECCINNKCSECPLKAMNCSENVAMAYANSLINRQQAEIERLREWKRTLQDQCDYWRTEAKQHRQEISQLLKKIEEELGE